MPPNAGRDPQAYTCLLRFGPQLPAGTIALQWFVRINTASMVWNKDKYVVPNSDGHAHRDEYGFEFAPRCGLVNSSNALIYSAAVRADGDSKGRASGALGILFNWDAWRRRSYKRRLALKRARNASSSIDKPTSWRGTR